MVAAEIAAISSSSMSSREKNRAIRKAKMLAKQRSKDASKEGDTLQTNRLGNNLMCMIAGGRWQLHCSSIVGVDVLYSLSFDKSTFYHDCN